MNLLGKPQKSAKPSAAAYGYYAIRNPNRNGFSVHRCTEQVTTTAGVVNFRLKQPRKWPLETPCPAS